MVMRKLTMDELNRIPVSEYRKQELNPVIVVLDNIRSLHNVGSVFRTADAFSLSGIYLCGITATPPHREIHRSALGATESVPWKYFSASLEAVQQLKKEGALIIAIEQTTKSIRLENVTPDMTRKTALIFGNEIHGVSGELLPLCDMAIEIPQFGSKHSLNVAVSAGIVLWELYGKKKKNI